jgi:hypothetical protein
MVAIPQRSEFFWPIKLQDNSTWISYTFSTNDYDFVSFIPSQFPNNNDIRHSASLGINYDINTNLKLSVGGIWRRSTLYNPSKGEETSTNGNTMTVNTIPQTTKI